MTNSSIKINRPELNKRNAAQVAMINWTLDNKSNAQYHKVHGVLGIVLFDDNHGRPCAHFYWRDRKDTKDRYYYPNNERRAEAIADRIKQAESYAERIEERKVSRRSYVEAEVGDVFATSWGYEQTNVEFYQVVARRGKTTVELREISMERVGEPTSWCSENVRPVKDSFVGEAFTKRLTKYGIKINSSATARKTDLESTHHRSWGY